jgi:hypothetical protein
VTLPRVLFTADGMVGGVSDDDVIVDDDSIARESEVDGCSRLFVYTYESEPDIFPQHMIHPALAPYTNDPIYIPKTPCDLYLTTASMSLTTPCFNTLPNPFNPGPVSRPSPLIITRQSENSP